MKSTKIVDAKVAQFRSELQAELRKFKDKSKKPWYSEEEIQERLKHWGHDMNIRDNIVYGSSPESLASLIKT